MLELHKKNRIITYVNCFCYVGNDYVLKNKPIEINIGM